MSRILKKIKKPTWVANKIMKIITAHQGFDFQIYFNNKRWDISMDWEKEKIKKEVTENIKASDYGEYMNDQVISVDFSSDTILWEQMNYGGYEIDGYNMNTGWKLINALDEFMEKNGLAKENGTSTDFIIINEEDL